MRKTNVKRDKILHSEKDTFKEKLLVGHRCLVIFDFNNTKNALSFSKAESLLHTENAENLQRGNSWKLTTDFSLFLTKNVFCVRKTNVKRDKILHSEKDTFKEKLLVGHRCLVIFDFNNTKNALSFSKAESLLHTENAENLQRGNSWKLTTDFSLFLTKNVFCVRKTNVKRDKILHSEKDTFKEKLLVGHRCLVIFDFNNTKNALSFSKAESLLHTENAENLQRGNSWKLTTDFSLFLTKNVFCVRKTNVKRDKILHSEKDTFKEKLLVGHRCLVIFDFNNTKNALSFSKAESLLHTENAENLQRGNSWKLTTDFSLFLTKNVFCVRKTNVKRDKILHSEKDTFKEKLLVGHRCLVIFDFNNTKNALSFSKAESLLHTENAENLQGVNSWKLTSDFSLFLTKYKEGNNLRSSKTTNNINYISRYKCS